MSEPEAPVPRSISSATVEGNDAVCFTAGPEAAVVGAGTIHAYLAARRKCPKVAAGISLGALNAVAMQRAYRELRAAEGRGQEVQEAARWTWFRHYAQAMADQPWRIIWDALPNRSDFFADMIPIRDASLPAALQRDGAAARRQQYLLVKLGRWLAKLPVTVRLVVGMLVNYVRVVERYPLSARAFSLAVLVGQILTLHARLAVHVCLSPQFFPEHKFREPASALGRGPAGHRCPIPLLPWINIITTTVLAGVALFALAYLHVSGRAPEIAFRATVGLGLAFFVIAVTAALRERISRWQIVCRIGESHVPVTMAYAFSFANLLLCTGAAAAWVLHLHDLHGRAAEWRAYAIAATALILLINLLAVSFVLVRQTRRWLFDHGFLLEFPRPLFGWTLYAFLWIHLAAVATYLALGSYLVAFVHARGLWCGPLYRAELLVGAAAGLLLMPAVPLIPVVLPVVVWRRLKSVARATAGWRRIAAWATTVLLSTVVVVGGVWLFVTLLGWARAFFRGGWTPECVWPTFVEPDYLWRTFVLIALLGTATWLVMATALTQPVWRRLLTRRVLEQVGLRKSLIHDLYLRRKLVSLLEPHHAEGPGGSRESERLSDDPMPVVLVAASLQTLYKGGEPRLAYQLWAKPGTPILDALRAALAWAPLLEPVRVTRDHLDRWLEPAVQRDEKNEPTFEHGIDLVDGSVVRQNPLPALFSFLRTFDGARDMVVNNDEQHPAIHVVYGVPIDDQPLPTDPDPTRRRVSQAGVRNTVVDVGLTSLRLSRRRDTQLEVTQTNIISRIEAAAPRKDENPDRVTHAMFADEIAPTRDLVVNDQMSPAPDEVLAGIAIGCRRSLETLYRYELEATDVPAKSGTVQCREFLQSMGRGSGAPTPGLPEVCGRCTGRLRVPTFGPSRGSTVSIERDLGNEADLPGAHPQLIGTEPRIVFVASGGVFRGAFHIGMLGALRAADVKPDLIVGASVGTLMGGALGAMFFHKGDVLEQLVDAFLRVDETVALTTTLKRAAREMGIRGRAIRLSPRQVRRLLRRGARSDASFATTGAPAALVDALADLLLIPHRQTGKIAADFIAGRVADGLGRLVSQLRSETIPRLDVERALLGTSLLEKLVAEVLTDGTTASRLERQPYQQQEGRIAFFGMTTDLSTQRPVVLGGQGLYPEAPYDFVEAALASSAFPAVFAARPEANVFPGNGRADVFLADGGMFDNLPFVPAIEILSHSQRGYRGTLPGAPTTLQCLRRRLEEPDLIIAGALDFVAERDENARGAFDSVLAIRARASSLHRNSKIRAFELASQRVYGQLQRIVEGVEPPAGSREARLLHGIVNAAVLPVFPASADHLNGTFAFCRSTGLDHQRVSRSIADGCYQTFLALADQTARAKSPGADRAPDHLAAKTIGVLVAKGCIRRVEACFDLLVTEKHCPYFKRDGARFPCPFTEGGDSERGRRMLAVFSACRRDAVHHTLGRARARQGRGRPTRSNPPGAHHPPGEAEGDMWSWRPRRGIDRLRGEVMAEIERNRVAFADMVMRSELASAPPPAAGPKADHEPALPAASAPASAERADVKSVLVRFAELSEKAKAGQNRDDLEQQVEEAEALAALRAYICPGKEIATEARACLLTLVDWGVPTQVVDALKEVAAPALTPDKSADADQARGALHAVYEEYDAWASYLETYNRNTGWWAAALMSGIALASALTLTFMLGPSPNLIAIVLASVAGSMASVIARLPGLTRYGEWMVNLRAFQARVATGIVGSLVGIGLLGSGLISITLPEPWQKTEYLFGACLGDTRPRAAPFRWAAPPAPEPSPAPSAEKSLPGPPKTCTPGAGLFVIAITMLFGFSERLLTSLEGRVITGPGGKPEPQRDR